MSCVFPCCRRKHQSRSWIAKTAGSTCLPPSEILVAHGCPLYIGNWADVLREMWWLETLVNVAWKIKRSSNCHHFSSRWQLFCSCFFFVFVGERCSNTLATTLHVQLQAWSWKTNIFPSKKHIQLLPICDEVKQWCIPTHASDTSRFWFQPFDLSPWGDVSRHVMGKSKGCDSPPVRPLKRISLIYNKARPAWIRGRWWKPP